MACEMVCCAVVRCDVLLWSVVCGSVCGMWCGVVLCCGVRCGVV